MDKARIEVRKPEEWEEGDPLELELVVHFNYPDLGVELKFSGYELHLIPLEDAESFARGDSKRLTFTDCNGASFMKNDGDFISFEVYHYCNSCVFKVPREGVMDEIIRQYKTFIE